MNAVAPIAHAGDWFVAVPLILIVIWLGVMAVRDRRARAGDEHEEKEAEDPE